jgi:membrane protease YdiL (CAAX protease family)
MLVFQLITLGLSALEVRPTLGVALACAMAADFLTVGVAWVFVARSTGSRAESLGLVVPRPKVQLITLPILGGVLSFVALTLAEVVYSMLTGRAQPPPQLVAQALAASEGAGVRILAVLAVALVAPLAEEIVFRGISFRGLRRRMGFLPAAVISAVLFSLAHLDLQHAIQLFAVGTVLAWATERSGSVLPGMILHAGVNVTSLLLIWDPTLLP